MSDKIKQLSATRIENSVNKLRVALDNLYGEMRLTTKVEFLLCDIAALCEKENISMSCMLGRAMDLYREEGR